jgi:hypothetical protein
MSIADESGNLPDYLTGRNPPKGWRVISNPIRQAHSESDELKTLIRTMQHRHQRAVGKRKLEETESPEAA